MNILSKGEVTSVCIKFKKNNYKFNPISLEKVVWGSWLFKATLTCLLFTHEDAGLEQFIETHVCGLSDLWLILSDFVLTNYYSFNKEKLPITLVTILYQINVFLWESRYTAIAWFFFVIFNLIEHRMTVLSCYNKQLL